MALHLTMLLAHGLSRVLAFAPFMSLSQRRVARGPRAKPVALNHSAPAADLSEAQARPAAPAKSRTLERVFKALSPRIAIAFGVPLASLPQARIVLAIATPEGPVLRKRTHHVADAETFFARPLFRKSKLPRSERLPPYFDLAIIGAAYPDPVAADIMAQLGPLAHPKSVLMLIRDEDDGSAGKRAEGLLADTLAPGSITRVNTAVVLAGNLLGKAAAVQAGPPEERSVDAFLGQFAIPQQQARSEAPRLVADAPGSESRIVQPIYRDIARHEHWREGKAHGYAVHRWWGQPLALLPTNITMCENVGILRCDSASQMWLVDEGGAPLPPAFTERDGFGPGADCYSRPNPPDFIFDAEGTKHPPSDAATLLDGTMHRGNYCLLGRADSRFGHMLLESLGRAWAVDWALERGMRFLAWDRADRFEEWFGQALGIPTGAIVTAEPGATYERLFIPSRGLRLCGSVSPVMAQLWDRIADHALATGEAPALDAPFVYLSRRANPRRRLLNEDALEQALVARGGLVIAPETLPFHDQVRLAAVAPALVGCAGSQLHLSIFAKPGARKLVIGNENHLGPDELLIGIAKGLEVTHYIERAAERGHDPMRAAWHLDLNRFLPAFDTWIAEKSATPPAPPAEPLVLT